METPTDSKPQTARVEPSTDEYVTALRTVIQILPTPDTHWHGLKLQGKRPEVVLSVISDLALELHVRIAKALGAQGIPTAPLVPQVSTFIATNVVALPVRQGANR